VIPVAKKCDLNHGPQWVLEIPPFNLEQLSADVTVLGDLCHRFALNDLRSYRLMI
jgi:hypothetical protein